MSRANNMGDIKEYISYIMSHKSKRRGQSEKHLMGNFSLDILGQEFIIGNIKKILFTEIR